ncbi:MAG: ABC transporter permease [bacterium]
MRALWAFARRDILNETSYRLSFFLQLLGILPATLMFFFLSRLVGDALSGPLDAYGGSYFPFVLVGIAVDRYLAVSLTSFSRSLRESQLTGTLEAVLATPVSVSALLAGSSLYAFGFNSLRVLLYLGVGSALFGVALHWARLPWILLVLALTAAAFSSLGILAASFTIFFKRGDPLNWTFSIASWLLGGVYYPLSVLPDGLQQAAQIIPLTHSLEALRRILLGGAELSRIGPQLLALSVWSAVGIPLSVLCFRFALRRARANGTLGHY